jgi:protein gp37
MLGVSAEDRHCWNLRVPALRRVPAAARFVSVEPFLADWQAARTVPVRIHGLPPCLPLFGLPAGN